MTGKERSSGFVDKYEKLNWFSMVFSLLIVGGSVGTAIALVDSAQIAAIRYYKNRRKLKD